MSTVVFDLQRISLDKLLRKLMLRLRNKFYESKR